MDEEVDQEIRDDHGHQDFVEHLGCAEEKTREGNAGVLLVHIIVPSHRIAKKNKDNIL